MTEHQPVVTGWIDYYNTDKGFGFAYAGPDRVFFHLSGCRQVDGTPEEPILTDRPDDRVPRHVGRGRRSAERIVVKVVQGKKGPKAAAWGFIPTRTWLEDLAFRGWLNGYGGGELHIEYSRNRTQAALTAR